MLQHGFRQRLVDKKSFGALLKRVTLSALGFALVGTLIGAFAAPLLVNLAFGPAYAQAAPLLVWVLASLIFVLPGQVLTQGAIALNRERAVWIAFAIGLVTALLMLLYLVPTHGALGTAWAMLIGHASVLVVLAFSLRGCLKN